MLRCYSMHALIIKKLGFHDRRLKLKWILQRTGDFLSLQTTLSVLSLIQKGRRLSKQWIVSEVWLVYYVTPSAGVVEQYQCLLALAIFPVCYFQILVRRLGYRQFRHKKINNEKISRRQRKAKNGGTISPTLFYKTSTFNVVSRFEAKKTLQTYFKEHKLHTKIIMIPIQRFVLLLTYFLQGFL